MARKKMTKQELQDWESLYYYVKKNVMNYDENQALPSSVVLRLKGLSTNKYMENNNIKSTANYSYKTILNTFRYCSPEIQKALRTCNWASENHKLNYILKIVEPKINDVYMKEKRIEKTEKETEAIDISQVSEYVNTFKKKEKKKNNRLDELW